MAEWKHSCCSFVKFPETQSAQKTHTILQAWRGISYEPKNLEQKRENKKKHSQTRRRIQNGNPSPGRHVFFHLVVRDRISGAPRSDTRSPLEGAADIFCSFHHFIREHSIYGSNLDACYLPCQTNCSLFKFLAAVSKVSTNTSACCWCFGSL